MGTVNTQQTAEGVVIESLPNATFRVMLTTGVEIKAYLAGKMRRFRIRVLVGDKVVVEMDQYGEKHRLIKRL